MILPRSPCIGKTKYIAFLTGVKVRRAFLFLTGVKVRRAFKTNNIFVCGVGLALQ